MNTFPLPPPLPFLPAPSVSTAAPRTPFQAKSITMSRALTFWANMLQSREDPEMGASIRFKGALGAPGSGARLDGINGCTRSRPLTSAARYHCNDLDMALGALGVAPFSSFPPLPEGCKNIAVARDGATLVRIILTPPLEEYPAPLEVAAQNTGFLQVPMARVYSLPA